MLVPVLAVVGAACGGGGGADVDTGAGDDASAPTTQPAPGDSDGDLTGRTFVAVAARHDGSPKPLVAPSKVRLAFETGGRLAASGGCNSMGGRYRVESGQLVVDELAQTEMACDGPLMDQEVWLGELLQARPEITVDGDRLVLAAPDRILELRDHSVAEPDRPVRGTTWELDGIVRGETVSSVPAGTGAVVTFDDTSVRYAVEGCNSGSGAARIDEEARTITFGTLVGTKMGCRGDAAEVEAALHRVLRGTVPYESGATTLRLTHPDGDGLVFRARS